MKLRITESERAHILNMHQSAKLKNLLREDEFGGLFSLENRKLDFKTLITGYKAPGSVDMDSVGGFDQLPNGENGNNYYVKGNTVYINIGPYSWSEDNKIEFLIRDKSTTVQKGTPSCVKLSDPNPGLGKGPAYVTGLEREGSTDDCGYTFYLTVPIVPNGVGKPQNSQLGPYDLVDKNRPDTKVGDISFFITFDERNKVESKVKEKTGPKRLPNNIRENLIIGYSDDTKKTPVNLRFGEVKVYSKKGIIREVYVDDERYYTIYTCGQQFISESGLLELDLYDGSGELTYVLEQEPVTEIDVTPNKKIYLSIDPSLKVQNTIDKYWPANSSKLAECDNK